MLGDKEVPEGQPVLAPPKKRAGRKKVARRLQAKHVKERGKYVPKSLASASDDIADCVFSDDEMKNDFLTTQCDGLSQQSSDQSDSSSVLGSSDATSDSMSIGSPEPVTSPPEVSEPSSAGTPRPTSALSTASDSLPQPESTAGNVVMKSGGVVQTSEPANCLSVDSATECITQVTPALTLVSELLNYLRSALPSPWLPIADSCGVHLVLPSPSKPLAIQREIFVSFNGNVSIYMHCALVPSYVDIFGLNSSPLVPLHEECFNDFCSKALSLLKKFLQFNVCVGADDVNTKDVWYMISETYIDNNPYQESKYSETCRSLSCCRIVELGHGKRCKECAKVMKYIADRKSFLLSENVDASTNNQNLTRAQAINKLQKQHQEIKKKDKQLFYLRNRMQQMIEEEGVNITDDLSEDFSTILMSAKGLTETQKWFLQEQWSCASKSNSRSHRWHPSMIRLALHLHMRSPSAYSALRDLGIVRLPCQRTLFDYSHAIKAESGVNGGLVQLVYDTVEGFDEVYKHYHVLLCDGMHIAQNLVFRRSDGDLVGFANLDDLDKEMQRFDKYVGGHDPVLSAPVLATEVLAYLVKGLASDVKVVVASYPCKVLSKEMLYSRSWEVIRRLEMAGIKVLAFVCDGYPVNRAFFQMHTPINTDTHFGVVFNTINICAPDRRPLFFVSDVCHLLKTLRNAFHNSGEGPKKPRWLELNGEKIEWKSIVRLYFTYKSHNFRKSYKLNAQNVFPNSYSRMRVRHAAHVLSNTVAQDLEDQNWPRMGETVKFIRYCNKFFDVLNGAHSSQAGRSRNADLAAYSTENVDSEGDIIDQRFDWLKNVFLEYLVDWKKQVDAMPLLAGRKEKLFLPQATYEGIEISIRAIEGAIKYFLNHNNGGGRFVMARIFSQDPLEQHFSKQRMGGGGNRNPNYAAFLQRQVSTAVQRDLGVRSKRGNVTDEGSSGMSVTDEPLAKRPRKK